MQKFINRIPITKSCAYILFLKKQTAGRLAYHLEGLRVPLVTHVP